MGDTEMDGMDSEEETEVEKMRRRRAERFGIEYTKSSGQAISSLDEALTSAKQQGEVQAATGKPLFVAEKALGPGFDMFAPDQIEKRAARKEKFGEVEGIEDMSENLMSEDERQKRLERAKKYGVSTTEVAAEVVMDVDVYENRRDAAATEELRPDTIYVYGTDKMATASVLGLFKGCAPKGVEWLNDSSANVVFNESSAVLHAIQSLCTPLGAPTEDMLTWHKYVADRKVKGIIVRHATTSDIKNKKGRSRNLWHDDERKHGGKYLPRQQRRQQAPQQQPAARAREDVHDRLGVALQSRAARAEAADGFAGDATADTSVADDATAAAKAEERRKKVLAARNAADEKWVDAEELGADTKKKGRGDFLYEALMRDIYNSNDADVGLTTGALRSRRGRGNKKYRPYETMPAAGDDADEAAAEL